jgi:hypothetical protein
MKNELEKELFERILEDNGLSRVLVQAGCTCMGYTKISYTILLTRQLLKQYQDTGDTEKAAKMDGILNSLWILNDCEDDVKARKLQRSIKRDVSRIYNP